jgi:hypothetical protein
VWKPRTVLAPIDPEPFQTGEEVLRERGRPPVLVREGEHAHAPRLAVAGDLESRPRCGFRRRAKLSSDRPLLGCGPPAEERQRDVEVLPRNDSFAKLAALPADELVEDILGEAQCTEEP